MLDLPSDVAIGDPGLLADHLLGPEPRETSEVVGLVPHYVDVDLAITAQLGTRDGWVVIDPRDDVTRVVRSIAACEAVLSSSLHGLVVADALGVPNRWLPLLNRIVGGDFKFRDYYSVFGLGAEKASVDDLGADSADLVDSIACGYRRPGIDDIRRRIHDAFPFA